jgi:hypothetical protein
MNKQILYVAIGAMLLSSCSSAYKTGQTPDDVYYSPGEGVPAAVPPTDDNTSYYDPSNILYLGSFYNNYPCIYTPYYDGYIYNHYYNSYYYPYPVYAKTYSTPYVNTIPRMVNLNAYNTNTYNNNNVSGGYLLRAQAANPTTTLKTIAPVTTGNKIGSALERIFSSPAGYDNNNSSSNNNNAAGNNTNYNTNTDRNYAPINGGDNNAGAGSRPARNGR